MANWKYLLFYAIYILYLRYKGMKNKNVYRKIEKPSGVEVTYPTLVDLVSLYKDDFGVFELIYNNGEVIPDESDSEHVMTRCKGEEYDCYLKRISDNTYEYIGELYPGDVLGFDCVIKEDNLDIKNNKLTLDVSHFPLGIWFGLNIDANNVGEASRDSVPLYRAKVDKFTNPYVITRYKWYSKYNTNKTYFEVNLGERIIEINDSIKEVTRKLATQIVYSRGRYMYSGAESLLKRSFDGAFNVYKGIEADRDNMFGNYCNSIRADATLNIHYKVKSDPITGDIGSRDAVWVEKGGVNHFLTEMTLSV